MSRALARHPSFPGVAGPVVVCILDGVGIGRHDDADAVWVARTPQLDWLASHSLSTVLRAHGRAVGMPSDADMGNSEVGHNALGCGRVYDQGAKLVAAAIASGALYRGKTWGELVGRAKRAGAPIHFLGLLSDGNVHSHIDHLLALIDRCDEEQLLALRVHALLDGRDVPETSALEYIDRLENHLEGLRAARGRDYRIASGGGRMVITMDRYEADWSMVERGWDIHVRGAGRGFKAAREAIETLRRENPGVGDQFLPPFVVVDDAGDPVGPIRDGASVVMFNFRGDRAMEISRAFEDEAFAAFDRSPRPDVAFAGMMQYDGDLGIPRHFLVEPPAIDDTMGELLAASGETQLAISETQKFGHVTYFWNGNRSGAFDERLETYVEIPSQSRPFEERPWMRAAEITDRLIDELRTGRHRFARLNYANGDMVGHTGDLEATITAIQAVDLQVGRLIRCVDAMRGALVVTADHGNADEMVETDRAGERLLDADGRPRPKTSHSLNAVPFWLHAPGVPLALEPSVASAGLANVAATTLQLLGYAAPAAYEPSLLKAR